MNTVRMGLGLDTTRAAREHHATGRAWIPDCSWTAWNSLVADALEGFFWLAGQGGYGIQSAPALSRVAAAMIGRRALPADVLAEGFTADSVAVGRTRARASFAAPSR